jgi:chromosome segregation ATPase
MSPESVNQFVDAYEEKIRITNEMSTLEARAAHGRIPRRRYKVQRMAMEQRLESLTNTIGQLKEVLRGAGGSFADLVRQLEAAEVESEETQLALKNLEIHHETGEIGLEAYRKQLTDLERRKTKAETRVNELLLRVRAELR